ncbi:GNAT family N-acetyltransferase [Lachnospiraceae bacterium 62-35]
MDILFTKTLNDNQKQELSHLISCCEADEPSRLLFSLSDDEGSYFLGREGNNLIAALALYPTGDILECTAAVIPERRRQGFFQSLLSLAEKYFPERDFHFLTDGNSPTALAVLSKLGCTLLCKELLMRLNLEDLSPSSLQQKICSPDLFIQQTFDKDSLFFHAFLGSSPIGTCSVFLSGKQACIWGMEIKQPFLGQGFGTSLLFQVLFQLSSLHTLSFISLHVDSENLPAVSLYQKAGFQVEECIYYYLY